MQIGKSIRTLATHPRSVAIHDIEIHMSTGRKIALVNHRKVGPRDARSTFARYFLALANGNYIKRQIR